MGVSIGGVDLLNEIIDLRFQLLRTQLILQHISTKANVTLTPEELITIENDAFTLLKQKFPHLGLTQTASK